MNQIQFIREVEKLNIFKLNRAGNYFVEFSLIEEEDITLTRAAKIFWKKKESLNGKDVYILMSFAEIALNCKPETKKILMDNEQLFR